MGLSGADNCRAMGLSGGRQLLSYGTVRGLITAELWDCPGADNCRAMGLPRGPTLWECPGADNCRAMRLSRADNSRDMGLPGGRQLSRYETVQGRQLSIYGTVRGPTTAELKDCPGGQLPSYGMIRGPTLLECPGADNCRAMGLSGGQQLPSYGTAGGRQLRCTIRPETPRPAPISTADPTDRKCPQQSPLPGLISRPPPHYRPTPRDRGHKVG